MPTATTLRGPGRGPRLGLGRRRHPHRLRRQQPLPRRPPRARHRPSAASASSSAAAARTTITPPCGPRASAARWASACWTTSSGNNHYYCGGMYVNSYNPETPGYEGWGQGVGGGIRQVADGGIGVIPRRRRRQRLRVRLSLARRRLLVRPGLRPRFRRQHQAPDHPEGLQRRRRDRSALPALRLRLGLPLRDGLLLRRQGRQTSTKARSWAPAWPGTARWACSATSAATTITRPPAASRRATAPKGFGILFDYGDDSYEGYGQGYASANFTYHNPTDCGGNFSFLVDYGNGNTYGCGAAEHTIVQRGTSGGFLISRPRHDQSTPTVSRPSEKTTAGPVR